MVCIDIYKSHQRWDADLKSGLLRDQHELNDFVWVLGLSELQVSRQNEKTWKRSEIILLSYQEKVDFCNTFKVTTDLCIAIICRVYWKNKEFHNISKVSKVGNLRQGRPEGSFSIATTPRCRGGHYSFPWIVPLYLWSIPYNAEC